VDLPGSIPLYTRRRREIPNAQDQDLPRLARQRVVDGYRKKYPLVRLRRPPCGQYNCHGLTFANRRTGIHDPDAVSTILADDGFREIRLSDVQCGDLVVYLDGGEISHTGVVLEVKEGVPADSMLRAVKIISKWGNAAEYVHMATDGPYSGHVVTYWTDRP